MAEIDRVTPDVQAQVLEEFRSTSAQWNGTVVGGTDRTLDLIENLLPERHAASLRPKYGRERAPIEAALHGHQPTFVAATLLQEDPQTIALILSQLPYENGARVLSELSEELRTEVVLRLAGLEPVSRALINQVARALEQVFRSAQPGGSGASGTEAAAEVVGRIGETERQSLLEAIERADQATAEELRHALLRFDHLVSVDDRGFRKLLQQSHASGRRLDKEVPMEELVVAMKTAPDEMRDKIYRNLSNRAGEALREEEESLGPRKLSEVEARQRAIVEIARSLADQGELVIGMADDEDYV